MRSWVTVRRCGEGGQASIAQLLSNGGYRIRRPIHRVPDLGGGVTKQGPLRCVSRPGHIALDGHGAAVNLLPHGRHGRSVGEDVLVNRCVVNYEIGILLFFFHQMRR